jgi:DNA-binding beta-propeller fold protein YncE
MEVASAGGPTNEMFATLQVRSTLDLSLVASRALCVAPHGVVTTRDDKTAFVACYGTDEIAVVDLGSPGLGSARYPLGASPGPPGAPRYGPYSVALSPDESRVAVSNLEGQSVRVFDRTTRRFGADIPLGARAFMSAWVDGRTIVAPLQAPDGLARIDLDEGTVVSRVTFEPGVCISPHVVRVARDGRAYLVCAGDHTHPG